MTKEEKSEKINKIARESYNKDELIELVTDYYIRDVLEIEPSIETSHERSSVNRNNQEGYNAKNLMDTIIYSVNNYNPIDYPDISLLQFLGDTIGTKKGTILPNYRNGKVLEPEDKPPAKQLKDYWKLMTSLNKLEIDINMMTTENITSVCQYAGISESEFNSIMRAGNFKYTISIDGGSEDDEDEDYLGNYIADNFDGFDKLEYKLFLLSWFIWLAQNEKKKKQPIYKMMNTNYVLECDFYITDFPDHTDYKYCEYAEFMDYIDATIIKYLNYVSIDMSKQNFHSTYRIPYNGYLKRYITTG